MKILLMPAYFFPEKVASTHLDYDKYSIYGWHKINTIVYAPWPTRGIDESEIRKTKKMEYMFNNTVQVNRFYMFREGKNPILRAIRYILVNVKQYCWGAKCKDVDLIYSGSTPPTEGLLCGLLKKKLYKKYKIYVPYVLCLQDIFPDSLVNSGMTHRGSFLWKIGRKIENYTYNSADRIIVINDAFKRNIIKKGVPEEKITIISNWIDLKSVHPVPREKNSLIREYGLNLEKFIVLYAGNFGATQGADIVLQSAQALCKYKKIQFVIFGGGPYFEEAVSKAKNMDNVFIHELLPQERVSEVYSLGDVALITCKAGTGNAGMPSKTWSIMACNTPIIASFDTDSALARVIEQSNAGECVTPEDESMLTEAILRAYHNKTEEKDLRSYVKLHASKEKCVESYIRVLKETAMRKHK